MNVVIKLYNTSLRKRGEGDSKSKDANKDYRLFGVEGRTNRVLVRVLAGDACARGMNAP